ncbi:MAG TPA: farnesyl diphosphate synthase [Candidatus Limnocylindrales bacterium]|nr:farnesyl diphosphate synthase [Candidatus Limnocylindrales bacterium]
MIDFDRYLEQEKERVNQALERCLPVSGPTIIIEAMRYSLAAGGKRLRPIITLATAETLGANSEEVIEVACAVELIHTYSLIHDDLPAMDDSDLRRGKPSCHCMFGEAVAILAGDALLTLAFEVLARYGLEPGRERAALLISAELAQAAGAEGMIGGQVFDLHAEGSVLSTSELELMNGMKTGALFRGAVRVGALAANASPEQLQILSGYAAFLGLAFQIVDDLLNHVGTQADLGKPAGSDQIRFKATYPALIGVEASRKRAGELCNTAIEHLDRLDRPADRLRDLARRLVFRTT